MNVIAPERPIHEGERIIMLFDLISSDLASMGHYLENSPFTKLVLARTAHNEVTSSSHIRTHIILFWVEQRFSAANIEFFFFVIPSGPFSPRGICSFSQPAQPLHSANRAGENAEMSYSGFAPVTTCAITCAVTGVSKIPSRKCPVATKYPGVAVAPKIGRLSGVPGL